MEQTEVRKAQIRRWLSKPEDDGADQVPGQIPFFDVGKEEKK